MQVRLFIIYIYIFIHIYIHGRMVVSGPYEDLQNAFFHVLHPLLVAHLLSDLKVFGFLFHSRHSYVCPTMFCV